MGLIRKIPWTSQPPAGTPLDWSNPITRELVVVASGAHGPFNLVTGEKGTIRNNGMPVGAGPHGMSFQGNPSGEQSNGIEWAVAGAAGDHLCTMLSLHSQDQGQTDYSVERLVISARMNNTFHTMQFSMNTFTGAAKCNWTARDNASNVSILAGDVPLAEIEDTNLITSVFKVDATNESWRLCNGLIATATPNVSDTNWFPTEFAVGQAASINIGEDSEVEDVYLAALWLRSLSVAEAWSIHDNPWQIFQPRTQIIGVEVGGAPATSNPKGPLGHVLHGPLGGPI